MAIISASILCSATSRLLRRVASGAGFAFHAIHGPECTLFGFVDSSSDLVLKCFHESYQEVEPYAVV